jgi:hypothetical protein
VTGENFGWPCYEGNGRQSGYDGANLNICEDLYAQAGAVTAPLFAYDHSVKVVTGETCPTGSSSIAGLAFYRGSAYPASYDGALFFADYSRACIWVMFKGANGLPDPATRQTFKAGAAGPVQLKLGPDGNIYYVDLNGTIRRFEYFAGMGFVAKRKGVLDLDRARGTLFFCSRFNNAAAHCAGSLARRQTSPASAKSPRPSVALLISTFWGPSGTLVLYVWIR